MFDTTYKIGDDWEMVYGIVLPTLHISHHIPRWILGGQPHKDAAQRWLVKSSGTAHQLLKPFSKPMESLVCPQLSQHNSDHITMKLLNRIQSPQNHKIQLNFIKWPLNHHEITMNSAKATVAQAGAKWFPSAHSKSKCEVPGYEPWMITGCTPMDWKPLCVVNDCYNLSILL